MIRPARARNIDQVNLRHSRLAIFMVFGLNGLLLALWAVHIPAILERTHTSHATLGLLLLLLGAGAVAGMQAGGHLADRWGSKRMVLAYALWIAVGIVPLGLATHTWQLALAMIFFGIGNGGLDVSMNLQAAVLEEKYDRPIMSAFHAFFSIGTFAGALAGALALNTHMKIPYTFIIAGAAGIILLLCSEPYLLPHGSDGRTAKEEPNLTMHAAISWAVWMRILLVGGLAFLLLLSEGVANDWSALQIKDHLHVSEAQAALGYAAFAILMTVGRFSADKVSAVRGAVAVVRYGSLLAACGMLLVVVSNALGLTLIGWGLFGFGLSGCAPQLFTVAGKISKDRQGVVMSRVVGMGYIGLLAGPAIIGGLTHFVSLTAAMLLPLAFTLVSAFAAGRVIDT